MRSVATLARVIIPLALVVLLAWGPFAYGRGAILDDWIAYYPNSNSVQALLNEASTDDCQLCHRDTNGGSPWNGYGWALKQYLDANSGATNQQAFAAVEGDNSDGAPNPNPTVLPNGWTNLLEITYHGQPGWTAGDNTMYDRNGNPSTTTAITGVTLEPDWTLPVVQKTWGGIKTMFGGQATRQD